MIKINDIDKIMCIKIQYHNNQHLVFMSIKIF